MCSKIKTFVQNLFIYSEPPLYIDKSPISPNLQRISRIISVLYLSGFYFYDFTNSKSLFHYFKYLTNWGYFITWLYFVLVNQHILLRHLKGNQFFDAKNYLQIIFQTILCTQVFIVLAFWAILYTSGDNDDILYIQISQHGIPLFFLIVQLILSTYRFILTQFCSCIVVMLLYVLAVNMPYSLAVKPVYGFASNYRSWVAYVLILAYLFIAGLVFLINRALFKKCKEKYLEADNQSQGNKIVENQLSSREKKQNQNGVVTIQSKNQIIKQN